MNTGLTLIAWIVVMLWLGIREHRKKRLDQEIEKLLAYYEREMKNGTRS